MWIAEPQRRNSKKVIVHRHKHAIDIGCALQQISVSQSRGVILGGSEAVDVARSQFLNNRGIDVVIEVEAKAHRARLAASSFSRNGGGPCFSKNSSASRRSSAISLSISV